MSKNGKTTATVEMPTEAQQENPHIPVVQQERLAAVGFNILRETENYPVRLTVEIPGTEGKTFNIFYRFHLLTPKFRDEAMYSPIERVLTDLIESWDLVVNASYLDWYEKEMVRQKRFERYVRDLTKLQREVPTTTPDDIEAQEKYAAAIMLVSEKVNKYADPHKYVVQVDENNKPLHDPEVALPVTRENMSLLPEIALNAMWAAIQEDQLPNQMKARLFGMRS